MTHICVGNRTIIGSDNGLSPGRRQAITWTNVGILLIGPLGTNFSEMSIEIHTFSFKKIHLKMSSGKWRPFCLGLNVLRMYRIVLVRSTLYYDTEKWCLNCDFYMCNGVSDFYALTYYYTIRGKALTKHQHLHWVCNNNDSNTTWL